jgi:hypothetical protein
MKRFLKKVLLYIVVPVVVVHLLFLLAYQLISLQVEDRLHEIAKKNSILIMGDSQMQKFVPELIDGDVENLAFAGEHYFVTYSKLKKLVAVKDYKIRTILLGVSLHNFAPLFINHFDFNHAEGKITQRQQLYFFDLFDNEFMRPHQIILNKDFFLGVINGPFWGGHDVLVHNNPDTLLLEWGVRFVFGDPVNEKLSSTQPFYLNKIVELCKQENISLVFVSAPAHAYYKSHVDASYYEKLQQVISEHSNLLHLNFLVDSTQSIYMSDASHLNKEGAELYTRKINSELKNHQDGSYGVRSTGN